MIQWNNLPIYMPMTTLFNGSQMSYTPQTPVLPYIPFGNFTNISNYLPTPQGIQSYTNPFGGWFNFSLPTLSNISYPQITMPTFNFTNFWSGVTNTAGNLYNSAKTNISNAATKVSNFASRIVAGAKKYLGYNEKDGSYKKFTDGRTEAWCADFATYVARENGANIPHFSSVSQILDWGQKNSKFSKTPKVGDLVIFKGYDKRGKKVSHTGIVTAVENGAIKTIEGNTSTNNVAERTCSINDTRITGFVTVA